MERLGLQLAIHRSQAESIWGGAPEAVALFLQEADKASWNARAIDVRVPSHTSFLSAAVPLWREKLFASSLKVPAIKVLSGISAEPVRTISEIQDALSLQLSQTIRWEECLAAMQERGVTEVWDIGPGQDQTRLVQELKAEIHILDQPNS
jgi:[acyl-carrier-protein] S-malonyltransferase